MFLDKTDLSKTVNRHGTECCHVLSRSFRFLAAVLFEHQPVLVERGPVLTIKRLKTVKLGLDRQERVVQACQNIRILRHFLSQPVFSMFSHHFSSVFGLFTIVRGSVKAVQGCVCTFPIKICLLMVSLVAHWSNTTQRFLRSTVFAAVSGKILSQTSFATRSCIALLCNTWAAHGRRERRTGLGLRRGEASEASANAGRFISCIFVYNFTTFDGTDGRRYVR